ncbi:GNAT family N-acetyltransferase [Marispirochaeta sp.]|uniref:GNAT family N-acetyltransferase n=1 Tax=Marispirochaeta sp. TaxID=2038653 RepID=UPI0029C91187|nr:GNAT family N-acetyltransferase [Marispirochaeta sp.]
MEFDIREATAADFEAIWPIFHEVISAGETYGYDPDTGKSKAYEFWMKIPLKTFVLEKNEEVLGTYYIKPNHHGPGAHVCNCGYMVASRARGQGIATELCRHSQAVALDLGFLAMQFNFVSSSNVTAVKLWTKLGFVTVGRLPKAFKHPSMGFFDALVMYKWLEPNS